MNLATGETPLTRFLAELTLSQLRGIKAQYRDELDSIKQRGEVLEGELERIEQALREKADSKTKRRTPKQRVRIATNGKSARSGTFLWELIVAVMSQRSGSWNREQIYEALDKTGHAPKGKNPTNIIGNRLLDLEERGVIVKVGRGEFELSSDAKIETETPARESGLEASGQGLPDV